MTVRRSRTVRFGGCAGVLDGLIYAVGGMGFGSAHLASVERFSGGCGAWEAMAPMATGRANCAAAVVGRKLYVTA